MKTAAKISLAALVTGALSTSALADDGIYVSGYLKNTTQTHTIERDTGLLDSTSLTSLSEETDLGLGIALGYKSHFDATTFWAVEVFYDNEGVETRNLNDVLITEVELNATYGINLKAGFDVSDKFSLYGKIGNTWVDIDLGNSYTFAPPTTNSSETESEISFGFGMEYALSDKLSVIGEFTQISDLDFDPIPEVAVPGKINPNDLDLNSWKVGVSYSF